jgi:site-specific DNA-methyltransferase (adenine-specific)
LNHKVIHGDARDMSQLADGSVHLVVTSPPYFNLLSYPESHDQLGNMDEYEQFLDELDKVWAECFRVLARGGRMCCVVGDVCLARKKAGRHHVLPLGADITVRARTLGFDYLTPIAWQKVTNITMEGSRSSGVLGKPNQPGGSIKNDRDTSSCSASPAITGIPNRQRLRPVTSRRRTISVGFASCGRMYRGSGETSIPPPSLLRYRIG